jgi:hypothetical protein
MIPIQFRRATNSHFVFLILLIFATDCSDEIFRFVRCNTEDGVCDAEGTSSRSHRLAELISSIFTESNMVRFV